MSREQDASHEELEFIFRCFLRGLGDREVQEETGRAGFPQRDLDYVRSLRAGFEAGRKVLEEQTRLDLGSTDRPRQTGHARSLADLSLRLTNEVKVPPSTDIFSEPVRSEYHFAGRLSWLITRAGRARVFLPTEVHSSSEALYRCLLSHLFTSNFSDVASDISRWKRDCSSYLTRCYELLRRIGTEMRMSPEIMSSSGEDQPVVPTQFMMTICREMVDGPQLSAGWRYEYSKMSGDLWGLRWSGSTIAIAIKKQRLKSSERLHRELRKKFADYEDVAELESLRKSLDRLAERIAAELRKFRESVPLPGTCELCERGS